MATETKPTTATAVRIAVAAEFLRKPLRMPNVATPLSMLDAEAAKAVTGDEALLELLHRAENAGRTYNAAIDRGDTETARASAPIAYDAYRALVDDLNGT